MEKENTIFAEEKKNRGGKYFKKENIWTVKETKNREEKRVERRRRIKKENEENILKGKNDCGRKVISGSIRGPSRPK